MSIPAATILGLLALAFVSDACLAQAKRPVAKKAAAPAKPAPKSKVPKGPTNVPEMWSKVAKVSPQGKDAAKAAAARIDALVMANLAQHGINPNPPTNDAQFVRRIYLDITGTIPTPYQAQSFLASTRPDKREVLIDHLLGSPGYVGHSFNQWANLMRLVDRPSNRITVVGFHQWIKAAIRDNMPYDKMVYEMLTAEGHLWDNPATGYFMRDPNMPLDTINNTVRIFLGTRIGCAQCHDHPFDRWTQREFYQMAAFTFGVNNRLAAKEMGGNPVTRLREELKRIDPAHRGGGSFLRVIQANQEHISDANRALKLPHDYQYADGKPGEVVKAKVLFGTEPPTNGTPRQQFATWMTSKDNPRFAMSMANRLWDRCLGAGLIEPIDDIQDESEIENEELLKFLTSHFVENQFNIKEQLRAIYYSQTYQRQAGFRSADGGELYHFQGPLLRRMSAEQLWDSLLTMAVYNPDGLERLPLQGNSELKVDLKSVSAQTVLNKAKLLDEKYGIAALQKADRTHAYQGMTLARASELPIPLPANHFLRQFGQSDRELIGGDHTDGSVTQILTMFNGPITHMMLEEGSVIYDNVVAQTGLKQRIDLIFMSILSRMPTRDDYATARAEIAEFGNAGYGNVIWALINTKEFLFVQ
ncbi:MAG: DUF1549 domain-containing protein [Planctomycetales bacterium]|nr:DUF1549 domain-containing protein [Planctomycetales bacterium]